MFWYLGIFLYFTVGLITSLAVKKIRNFDEVRHKMISGGGDFYSRHKSEYEHYMNDMVYFFTAMAGPAGLIFLAWHLGTVKWNKEQRELVKDYKRLLGGIPQSQDTTKMSEAVDKLREKREKELAEETAKLEKRVLHA